MKYWTRIEDFPYIEDCGTFVNNDFSIKLAWLLESYHTYHEYILNAAINRGITPVQYRQPLILIRLMLNRKTEEFLLSF